MNRTALTLALACQMAAGAAFTQTDSATEAPDAGAMSGTYGSDWSLSLGPSLFGEDSTTLRTDTEIATQWDSLSKEDRAMLRRDCLAQSKKSTGITDGGTGTEGTTADTTADAGVAADTGVADTTAGATGAAAAGSPMMVSAEQMERICLVVKDL